MSMPETLIRFREHARRIKAAGGNLYVVGGAVREFMRGKEPKDVDFCVTGLTSPDFMYLFPQARLQGKDFQVFVVDGCEFSFARTEKKVRAGYKGFEINANPAVTIEEDLSRRDLTINSMAINVLTGELIDPFGGLRALKCGRLIPTSPAFGEDPVRVLRVARIAAETGFYVSSAALYRMAAVKHELHTISDDMKLKEIRKALVSNNPWKFIDTLDKAGVLDVLFPELSALAGVQQSHHHGEDALEHTLEVLAECRNYTDNPMILCAALYHDVGKGATPLDILPAHHDHEKRGADIIDTITWMPKDWKSFSRTVALEHMRGHRFSEMRRGKRVTFLERINRSVGGLEAFCTVLRADKPGDESSKNILNIYVTNAKIKSVTGHDLPANTPKDQRFGQMLHQRRVEALE